MRRQPGPIGVLRQHRTSVSIESQDQRRLFKIAHHDRDPAPTLSFGGGQMRMGLVPRTAKVEIGNLVGAEHLEGVGKSLGTEVDAAIGGSSRGKEDRLPGNHRFVFGGDVVGEFHGGQTRPGQSQEQEAEVVSRRDRRGHRGGCDCGRAACSSNLRRCASQESKAAFGRSQALCGPCGLCANPIVPWSPRTPDPGSFPADS